MKLLGMIAAALGAALGFLIAGPLMAVGGALAGVGLGILAGQFLGDDDGDGRVEASAKPRQRAYPNRSMLALPSHEEFDEDTDATAVSTAPIVDREARKAFISDLVALLMEVARADGVIRREEVRAIRAFLADSFMLTEDDDALVRQLLMDALARPIDIAEALRDYAARSASADRLLFLQALYEVALGDGELATEEQKVINKFCSDLDISEQDHRTIRGLFFDEPSADDDYALLGVAPSADDSVLKKAFREMAARHHPDRVAYLGADAAAMAGRRFAEIKLAYERIRQARAL